MLNNHHAVQMASVSFVDGDFMTLLSSYDAENLASYYAAKIYRVSDDALLYSNYNLCDL